MVGEARPSNIYSQNFTQKSIVKRDSHTTFIGYTICVPYDSKNTTNFQKRMSYPWHELFVCFHNLSKEILKQMVYNLKAILRIALIQKQNWHVCRISRGHLEGGPTARSKNFKTPFFKRYWKILSRGYSNLSRTSPFFSFWNISTNMVARGIQSFGQNGLWLAGW